MTICRKDKMKIEVVAILQNRETTKYHCPFCFKELKKTKEPFALECKKCKRYDYNPYKLMA